MPFDPFGCLWFGPVLSPPHSSAHTAAARRRQLLHLVPAVGVIQEGHVLVVGGSAAGRLVPHLPGRRAREQAAEQQVVEGEVVVGAGVGATPAAVLEQDAFVRVVAQPQVSNLQQDGAQPAVRVEGGAASPKRGDGDKGGFHLSVLHSWMSAPPVLIRGGVCGCCFQLLMTWSPENELNEQK